MSEELVKAVGNKPPYYAIKVIAKEKLNSRSTYLHRQLMKEI
jgi:hypothetical protein